MASSAGFEGSRASRFSILSMVVALVCVGLALAMAVALRAHYRNQPAVSDEVAHLMSPDGKTTALLYERRVAAGHTDFVYDVVLNSGASSQTVARLSGAKRNERAYGVDLRWAGDGELDLLYLSAGSAQVLVESVPAGAGKVRIVLKPGVADKDAPAGGMLRNLHETQVPVI